MGTKAKKKPKSKFRPTMLLTIYHLAKEGRSDEHISKALGIQHRIFIKWKRSKEGVNEALEDGRKKAGSGLKEYVFGRLPKKLQALWKELDYDLDEETPEKYARVRFILKNITESGKKQLFLHAWCMGFHSMSEACRKVGISTQTLAHWRKDPEFASLVEKMKEHKEDFLESAFWRKVNEGDAALIQFGCKTLLRHRGFNEKVEVEIKSTVNHRLTADDVPLEVRKALLQAYINKEQKGELLALPNEKNVEDAEYSVKEKENGKE